MDTAAAVWKKKKEAAKNWKHMVDLDTEKGITETKEGYQVFMQEEKMSDEIKKKGTEINVP